MYGSYWKNAIHFTVASGLCELISGALTPHHLTIAWERNHRALLFNRMNLIPILQLQVADSPPKSPVSHFNLPMVRCFITKALRYLCPLAPISQSESVTTAPLADADAVISTSTVEPRPQDDDSEENGG